MLAKKNRLTRQEFNQVRKSGKKYYSSTLLIYVFSSLIFKASVVVSKKISKRAVVRNSIRRQIYNYLQTKYLDSPFSIIIYLQKK